MSQAVQIVAKSDGLPSASLSLGQLQPLGSGKYAWIIAFFSLSTSLSYGTYILLLVHYVSNWGFSLQYLTVVGLITGIVGLFSSLYIGYYGDTFVSKYGRRKPVVFVGLLVSILSMFFLYIPPSTTNQKTMFSWMLLWQFLQTISSTFAYQSLNSWFIESTMNNADYERLNNFVRPVSQLFGWLIGLGLGLAGLPMIVLGLIPTIPAIISLVVFCYYVPNISLRDSAKQPAIIPSLRTCMRSKEFMTIFYNKIVLFSAISLGGGTYMYIMMFSYSFIKTMKDYITFIFIGVIATVILSVVSVAALQCYMNKYGKLKIYRAYTIAIAFMSVIIFILSTVGKSKISFYLFFLVTILITLLVAPLYAIDGFFVKDLVVYDTFVTGLNRENVYQMAMNLPTGIATSILGNIPMYVVYICGFTVGSNTVDDDQLISKFIWSESDIWQLRVYGTFGVAILCFISNYIIRDYPLNDSAAGKIDEIVKAKAAKKLSLELSGEGGDGDNVSFFSSALHPKVASENGSTGNPSYSTTDKADVVSETDDVMFMNHFSGLEVRYMHQQMHEIDDAINSLRLKMTSGIFLGFVCLIILSVGVILQYDIQQTNYIQLNMSIIQLILLYLLYEGTRLATLFKVASYSKGDVQTLITKAHNANEVYYEKLRTILAKSGVLDSANNDQDVVEDANLVTPALISQLSFKASSRKSLFDKDDSDNEVSLIGYKRIFTAFVVLIAYGVVSCTVLVYPSQEPVGHGPTIQPTYFPTII